MLFLGIIGAGGIFTGTNPAYTSHELSHHIRTSKAKFVITEPEMLDNIMEAAKECRIPTENVFVFDIMGQAIPSGLKSWKQLLQHGEQDWVMFDSEAEAKNTTAARMFSSGTMGLPKAAVISHFNFVAQHTLVFEINEPKHYQVSLSLLLTRSSALMEHRYADCTYFPNSTWPPSLRSTSRLFAVLTPLT